uniref:Uncharacterized protein n=1 Tax=Setaria digitata TaxID=48799 RepID=A0A915Q1A0_9BILA
MPRSRSRDRRRRSRSRSRDERRDRDRRYRKEKDRRRRRDSDHSGSDNEIESLLKRERRGNGGSSNSPSTSLGALVSELGSGVKFDASQLSQAAKEWLDARVTEQVSARVADLESLVQERVAKARADLESRLRSQIEQEMMHEVEESRKKELHKMTMDFPSLHSLMGINFADKLELLKHLQEESKKRCIELEESLEKKMKELEETEKKLNPDWAVAGLNTFLIVAFVVKSEIRKQERLLMLETKSKLEMERNALIQEREMLTKSEQQAILNKGGTMRAPIKLKLGFK